MKIFEIYNQLFESRDYGYFKDKAGIPDYDAILMGRVDGLPKKYAGWEGEIKWMTKEEYFRESAKLQNTSYEDQFGYVVLSKVEAIEEKMANGVKYDMPYLNYVDDSQEGRHRVMAASNLGQVRIPILVLYKEEGEVITDIRSMIGKWSDLVKVGDEYYCVFNNSHDLLSCIASDYDYYYLDEILDIEQYHRSIENFLFRGISNNPNGGPLSYLDYTPNFRGSDRVSEVILDWAVVLRAITNNYSILEAISVRGGGYYLRVLDSIKDDFSSFKSCRDMLMGVRRGEHYIDEYGLLSVSNRNYLYSVEPRDVNVILGLFKRANKDF